MRAIEILRRPVQALAASAALLCALSGCSSGNIQTAHRTGPAAPAVRHPLFDPYAPYGSAPVIWKPVVADRMQLGRPRDPVIEAGRPDYEHSAWSIEGKGRQAGTF